MRESLTSYLFPFSQSSHARTTGPEVRGQTPLTPPSSVSQNLLINQHIPTILQGMSLPLTPSSTSSDPFHAVPESNRNIVPLISSLFPYHATQVAALSHILEIVTPPDHVLHGFILDHPTDGRAVYVHLPPLHSSATSRPEALSPHFFEVLRPHDPLRAAPTAAIRSSANAALDMRESLTALLDLSAESLEASSLILALDKDDWEPVRLGELLHSLMYVGGQVIKQGALPGGWEWDPRRWVLVGMEL